MSKYLSSTAEYTIQVQIYIYIAKYETNSLIQYEDINKQSKYIYTKYYRSKVYAKYIPLSISSWIWTSFDGFKVLGSSFGNSILKLFILMIKYSSHVNLKYLTCWVGVAKFSTVMREFTKCCYNLQEFWINTFYLTWWNLNLIFVGY